MLDGAYWRCICNASHIYESHFVQNWVFYNVHVINIMSYNYNFYRYYNYSKISQNITLFAIMCTYSAIFSQEISENQTKKINGC